MSRTLDYVSRNATCKRCGSTDVTWNHSEKGKWYLSEVFTYDGFSDGEMRVGEMTDHRDFHSAYCGKPDKHIAKQASIEAQEREHVERRKREADEAEAARIEAEAEKLAKFLRMTPDERTALIEDLESEIKHETDGITMDYMTEWSRAVARAEALRAEINLYEDFMEDLA